MPSATEEEVREIFNFDGCKPIVSMRSDIEDTWFVIMDSEEDAKDTLLDLRFQLNYVIIIIIIDQVKIAIIPIDS